MTDDPIMEAIDDIFENGDDIPPKVSNRMLLAGIRKGWKASQENKAGLVTVMQMFTGDPQKPQQMGVFARLNVLERFKEGIGKFIWIAVAAFLTSLVGVVVQLIILAR